MQATKKAFEAVSGKLRVFLSYKRAQHAEVARLLRTSLQGLGAARINVFLDEAKIEPGQDWFNTIRTNLRSANCFVLLVPDDSDEREWPIFEAGIFAGRMLPGERLICLHHPAVRIPHQLAAFQGYQADAAGVERLLRRLLVEPHVVPGLEAINPDCEPFLEQHALKVAARLSVPHQRACAVMTDRAPPPGGHSELHGWPLGARKERPSSFGRHTGQTSRPLASQGRLDCGFGGTARADFKYGV